MTKFFLAALVCAAATPLFSGIGGFFDRAVKSVDVAIGNASPLENVEYQRDSIARRLNDACYYLEQSKVSAYTALENAEKSASARQAADAINSEEDLKVLANYLKKQRTDSAVSIIKSGGELSDEARKEVVKSMKFMSDALRAERLLLKDVAAAAAAAEALIKSLSGDEKKAAEEKVGYLIDFNKVYPKYVEETKAMLNSYIELARSKGIDTFSISKNLSKILSE